jgi:hypothetical protein
MNQTRFHVCLVLAYVRCALVCLKQMVGTHSSSPVAGGAVEQWRSQTIYIGGVVKIFLRY